MEIWNMVGRLPPDTQKLRDFRNNACFKFHKAGCRPCKHVKELRKASANNLIINSEYKDPQEVEAHVDNSYDSEN